MRPAPPFRRSPWALGSGLVLLATSLGLGACAGAPEHVAPGMPSSGPTALSPPEIPAPPDPEANRAPTPYSVAQLRAALKAGLSYEFLVERPGSRPMRRRMVFVLVSDESATISTEMLDADGKSMGPASLETASWNELRLHASFPKGSTTIADERSDTPDGSFECKRYVVTEQTVDGEKVSTYWFARDWPGPPVETRIELRGETVSTMTLLRFSEGL